MNLVADLLDKQLLDRRGHPCGKVDGIVLALEPTGPRVVAIEVGCVTLARRLGPRAARWTRHLVAALRHVTGSYRIPWNRIATIGKDVHLELEAGRTNLMRAEHWLRDHVVAKIPGA